ncbi:hypothetical protein [Undibacterium terreum]|uniref:Uncharacterized protein n=1 Tax=Undibacterium terreum TaxID=1224302 RepID=A0A916XP16_9BURK|nr:hypothetical protein [Undibacterium terreum]GGC87361.1 hypothetical protein GCM10011396_38260 [Undibacterium terreum]
MGVDIPGIELAKRMFQLHGADWGDNYCIMLRQYAQMLSVVRYPSSHVIAMKAFSSVHQWVDAPRKGESMCA